MFRKYVIGGIIILLLLCGGSKAQAFIVDLSDANGQGFFKDQATGFTWMDVDNFLGMSYTDIHTFLLGSDFHIATFVEIEQLKLAAPADPTLFDLHASIMGSSPTVNLIWGYYDEDGNPNDGGSWNFKWGSNPFNQPTDVWFTPIGSGTNQTFSNLGGWAVNTNLPRTPVIPEPHSLLLLGQGLLAFIAFNKKRAR
ncbi:MAG TPA: hypothetical protein VI749_07345 [Candidatus Omnitrophota bacterium]|nr:hypothetical protein [Candidatus Omnitrophota bacterium]